MKAQTEEWWSEWLGLPVAGVHGCGLPREDVAVIYHPASEQLDAGWYLAITWRATESDVAEGAAPEVNGILSATELTVAFCPFCGQRLDASVV